MRDKLKICCVASAGGHMTELLKLSDSWMSYEHFYITTTPVIKERLQADGRVFVTGECNRQHPWKVFTVLLYCVRIMFFERPNVVISTGAAGGCMACFLGKLLRAKVIWVDSIANVECVSLSGKMVRRIADLFLVQWPDLAGRYDNVEYLGTLI